jgi:hypothetical protein
MESKSLSNVSRRHLLGLGAAAGAATVAGMSVHLPFAAATDDPSPTGVQLPNYTAITQIPGLQATTLGYADFQAIGTGTGQGSRYADPPSVYNESGNTMQASLRLAVGAVLRRVDFFGFRSPSATGTQTFVLYRTNVPTSSARNTVQAVSLSGTGEVQGTIDLGTGLTVGLGDVFTLEGTTSNDANNRVVGAIYQYAPAGGVYVPIAPKRVYDSRQAAAGKIAKADAAARTVSVANEIAANGGALNVVPSGATGIAYNLTITDTEATFGYLTLVAGGAPTAGPSSINWDRTGATLANGLQGPLNGAREVTVLCGGDAAAKTHFLIDVLGYYL